MAINSWAYLSLLFNLTCKLLYENKRQSTQLVSTQNFIGKFPRSNFHLTFKWQTNRAYCLHYTIIQIISKERTHSMRCLTLNLPILNHDIYSSFCCKFEVKLF